MDVMARRIESSEDGCSLNSESTHPGKLVLSLCRHAHLVYLMTSRLKSPVQHFLHNDVAEVTITTNATAGTLPVFKDNVDQPQNLRFRFATPSNYLGELFTRELGSKKRSALVFEHGI